jgi:hypothetical protein
VRKRNVIHRLSCLDEKNLSKFYDMKIYIILSFVTLATCIAKVYLDFFLYFKNKKSDREENGLVTYDVIWGYHDLYFHLLLGLSTCLKIQNSYIFPSYMTPSWKINWVLYKGMKDFYLNYITIFFFCFSLYYKYTSMYCIFYMNEDKTIFFIFIKYITVFFFISFYLYDFLFVFYYLKFNCLVFLLALSKFKISH